MTPLNIPSLVVVSLTFSCGMCISCWARAYSGEVNEITIVRRGEVGRMIETACGVEWGEVVVAEGIRGRREDSRFADAGNSILLHRDRGLWSTFVAVALGSSFVGRGIDVEDDSNRIGVASVVGDSCIRETLVRRVGRMDGRKIERR